LLLKIKREIEKAYFLPKFDFVAYYSLRRPYFNCMLDPDPGDKTNVDPVPKHWTYIVISRVKMKSTPEPFS